MPIDASDVVWIATANDSRSIPEPILNRMNVYAIDAPDEHGARRIAGSIYEELRSEHAWGKVFPDELNAFLDAGMTLIDPVRLAADPEIWSEMPAIPYLTLRLATMATDYFQADRCLQMVKPAHAAFYKRVFDADFVASPKSAQSNDSSSVKRLR